VNKNPTKHLEISDEKNFLKAKKYIEKYFKYQFHNPIKFWNKFGGQKYFDCRNYYPNFVYYDL